MAFVSNKNTTTYLILIHHDLTEQEVSITDSDFSFAWNICLYILREGRNLWRYKDNYVQYYSKKSILYPRKFYAIRNDFLKAQEDQEKTVCRQHLHFSHNSPRKWSQQESKRKYTTRKCLGCYTVSNQARGERALFTVVWQPVYSPLIWSFSQPLDRHETLVHFFLRSGTIKSTFL